MQISLPNIPFLISYTPADNPLEDFYIPALSASQTYDRSSGYFSSYALAVAATGVSRLIHNGGRMRLLVGADLSEEDVEAIRKGHSLANTLSQHLLERFPEPEDALLKARLEVLAYMVAEARLQIKVVLPQDANGYPLPAYQTRDYYHAKYGIFTDVFGNQIAFVGSINETETGWKHNYETFSVYKSWDGTRLHLAQQVYNFDRLWNGTEPDWSAIDIPTAVKERLLHYRPSNTPPLRDPFEHEKKNKSGRDEKQPYFSGSLQKERLLFQYLRDAPLLPEASTLGAATAAIHPWPHQTQVADSLLKRFPQPSMLCDEVGLGKTIEAGLLLRQLLISGWVKRCLILVPKSVLRQWQEELYEKFALNIPRYDAGEFRDVDDQLFPIEAGNPWDSHDVFLAGSQLAKRRDRRAEILAAKGWDFLIVDEAHHARRKDFKEHIYRPNQLLGLLNELKLKGKYSGLLLMTATPMQVHPLEVWDLLNVLGLNGRWAADEDNFLAFFNEMRKPFDQIDWEFVFDMVNDYLNGGGEIEKLFAQQARQELGPVKFSLLNELPERSGKRHQLIKQLGNTAQSHVKELARRHTPLADLIYRNTRQLLREYQQKGILKAKVPIRLPRIERVELQPEEQALYDRIDEYISNFYHKYENERRGLGFVMTVYRRRLTSSFFAVRRSLERRLQYLEGQLDPHNLFQDEDLEQDELEMDVGEEILDPITQEYFKAELDYVKDFIQSLKMLSVNDSKLEMLKDELHQIFMLRSSVLIFTQYSDTMDYLRDQLCEVYGAQVACYSGRGGEIWNGIAWANTTKEQVKNDFKAGDIRILIGTESASEGLNLQSCGVLINYDMPWNPMRVEQRIGRIDRIGQENDEIWITNYFYRGTIEDQIHQRLSDRIAWFEVVVGELQPILAEIGEMTKRLAMLSPNTREEQLQREVESLKNRIDNRSLETLNLDTYLDVEEFQPSPNSPVTMKEIEEILLHSNTFTPHFKRHTVIKNAYQFLWNETAYIVTFNREVFDEHPDTLQFLTFGNQLFEELLNDVRPPETGQKNGLIRCDIHGEIDLHSWYVPEQNGVKKIQSIVELRNLLHKEPKISYPITEETIATAKAQTWAEYHRIRGRQEEIIEHRHQCEYSTLRVKAQIVLVKAATVEIALGRSPDIFETETFPVDFSGQSIKQLQRHGYPWTALLQLTYVENLAPKENSYYFQKIAHERKESLRGYFSQLEQEARKLLQLLSEAKNKVEKKQIANEVTAKCEILSIDD